MTKNKEKIYLKLLTGWRNFARLRCQDMFGEMFGRGGGTDAAVDQIFQVDQLPKPNGVCGTVAAAGQARTDDRRLLPGVT